MNICEEQCKHFHKCHMEQVECRYELELIINHQLASVDGDYKDFTGRLKYFESSGVVSDATFKLHNGLILWIDGTWEKGIFDKGIFNKGSIKSCQWLGGVLKKEVKWYDGTWEKGIFKGLWLDGRWNSGSFEGKWIKGEIYDKNHRSWDYSKKAPVLTDYDVVMHMIRTVISNCDLVPTERRIKALRHIEDDPIVGFRIQKNNKLGWETNYVKNLLHSFKNNITIKPYKELLKGLREYSNKI